MKLSELEKDNVILLFDKFAVSYSHIMFKCIYLYIIQKSQRISLEKVLSSTKIMHSARLRNDNICIYLNNIWDLVNVINCRLCEAHKFLNMKAFL